MLPRQIARWSLLVLTLSLPAWAAPVPVAPVVPEKGEWRLSHTRTIDAGLGDVYYAFSPDSGLLAAMGTVPRADPEANVADTPCLRVWSLATGKKVLERTWPDFTQVYGPLHFTRDGKSLIVLNVQSGLITWLDPKTGDRQRRVRVPTSERTGAFSPDDSTYAYVDSKGKLRVYDVETWKALQVLEVPGWQEDTNVVARFSPDGARFALINHHAVVHVWDCKGWKHRRRLHAPIDTSEAEDVPFYHNDLAFSPDGRTLGLQVRSIRYSKSDGEGNPIPPRGPRLFDALSGEDKGSIAPQLTGPYGIVFSRGGRYALTAGHRTMTWPRPLGRVQVQSQVTLYDLTSRKVVQNIDCFPHDVSRLLLSPDGRTLLVGAPGQAYLYSFKPKE